MQTDIHYTTRLDIITIVSCIFRYCKKLTTFSISLFNHLTHATADKDMLAYIIISTCNYTYYFMYIIIEAVYIVRKYIYLIYRELKYLDIFETVGPLLLSTFSTLLG